MTEQQQTKQHATHCAVCAFALAGSRYQCDVCASFALCARCYYSDAVTRHAQGLHDFSKCKPMSRLPERAQYRESASRLTYVPTLAQGEQRWVSKMMSQQSGRAQRDAKEDDAM